MCSLYNACALCLDCPILLPPLKSLKWAHIFSWWCTRNASSQREEEKKDKDFWRKKGLVLTKVRRIEYYPIPISSWYGYHTKLAVHQLGGPEGPHRRPPFYQAKSSDLIRYGIVRYKGSWRWFSPCIESFQFWTSLARTVCFKIIRLTLVTTIPYDFLG